MKLWIARDKDKTLFLYLEKPTLDELFEDSWDCPNKCFGQLNRPSTEEEKAKLFQAIKDNGYKWNDKTNVLEKLAIPKFDITTLKPFDKVLVRDNNKQRWSVDLFGFIDNKRIYSFVCIGNYSGQCIPYEGNEHLLGTADDCDDFYKTWK